MLKGDLRQTGFDAAFSSSRCASTGLTSSSQLSVTSNDARRTSSPRWALLIPGYTTAPLTIYGPQRFAVGIYICCIILALNRFRFKARIMQHQHSGHRTEASICLLHHSFKKSDGKPLHTMQCVRCRKVETPQHAHKIDRHLRDGNMPCVGSIGASRHWLFIIHASAHIFNSSNEGWRMCQQTR
ncbi:hypothetical protein H4S14_004312 [Agrobacterium vitis]|nr:hypothetical protein [Agrobacterium vitis]MBE1440532.1 hypothetical protein [Agrobacterium vitis]